MKLEQIIEALKNINKDYKETSDIRKSLREKLPDVLETAVLGKLVSYSVDTDRWNESFEKWTFFIENRTVTIECRTKKKDDV